MDHVYPLDRGGADVAENCRPTHPKCNLVKHNKLPLLALCSPVPGQRNENFKPRKTLNINTCGFSARDLDRLRAWCKARDITQSALIRALVRGVLSGKIKAPLGRRVDSE